MSACANRTLSRIPDAGPLVGCRPAASIPARIAGTGAFLLDLVSLWRARTSQRRRLSELPDYLLRDVGLTRADVEREVAKPFWRA
jgi:uncharacterized protein YjiS (DUF1127 family)